MSIDRTIAKYSGSGNYMKELAKITGEINTIDEKYYTSQISLVNKLFISILDLLKKYTPTTVKLTKFIKNIEDEYVKLNLKVLYIDIAKVKKGKGKGGKDKKKIIHKVRITPKQIYESNWFKLLSQIETLATDLKSRFFIQDKATTMSEEHKKLITDENVVSTFTFYDVRVDNDEITKVINATSKFLNGIIEILLSPMYDIKTYMDVHWLDKIDEVLGVELKSKYKDKYEGSPITQAEIKKYVYSFVITKYRLELTSNTEEFAKSLIKTLDPMAVGDANPARFINIIDSIKLDEISDSKGVKKMVGLARDELEKLSKNENIQPSEIIKDISDILNCDDDIPIEEPKEKIDEPDEVFGE